MQYNDWAEQEDTQAVKFVKHLFDEYIYIMLKAISMLKDDSKLSLKLCKVCMLKNTPLSLIHIIGKLLLYNCKSY